MGITRTSFASIPLLEVEGDLDHVSSQVFDQAVRAHLNSGDRLLLDLTQCAYIDSGGLGVLLSTVKNLPPDGWLGIMAPNNNLRRLFDIVGMNSYPGVRLCADYSAVKESLHPQADRVR